MKTVEDFPVGSKVYVKPTIEDPTEGIFCVIKGWHSERVGISTEFDASFADLWLKPERLEWR